MELNIQVLNAILEEFITLDVKEIKNKFILEWVKLIDPKESFWHIEGKKLWKKKAWLTEESRIQTLKKFQEEIKNIRDARVGALKSLQAKLAEFTGVEPELLFDLALATMKKRGKLGIIMGVDLENLPDMPEKYSIIEGKNIYEL